MKRMVLRIFILCLSVSGFVHGAELFVDLNCSTPTSPYTNWATAATDIQSAVDAAVDGDTVWVTNGVYNVGGKVLPEGNLTNRVCVTNSIELRSVNGPEVTIIKGAGPTGSSAVRCVVLTTNALLSGFTLTKGHCFEHNSDPISYTNLTELSGNGGGVLLGGGSVVSNCLITRNVGYSYGGGAYVRSGMLIDCSVFENRMERYDGGGVFINNGMISDCVISNNYTPDGGGGISAFSEFDLEEMAVIINCLIVGNRAEDLDGGGGVNLWAGAVLDHCVVEDNWTAGPGGGVFMSSHPGDSDRNLVMGCVIRNNWSEGNGAGICSPFGGGSARDCVIDGNTSFLSSGGGIYNVSAINCSIKNNVSDYGGGMFGGTSDGCLIVDNWAVFEGGGVYSGEVYNCTIADNSSDVGGGMYRGEAYNSIIYYNFSTDLVDVVVANSCAPGLVHGLYGNITNAPFFADMGGDNYRLSSASLCIDGGVNGYAHIAMDVDGNPRIHNSRVDMGAYEYSGGISDDDGDGLGNAAEARHGTDPQNPDSDGDGFEDGWEVDHGWNPTHDDTSVLTYIESNPAVFDYYTSESVGDLAMGEMMVGVSNASVNVHLQLMKSSDLMIWTNAGESVEWSVPATNKSFFRVRAQP